LTRPASTATIGVADVLQQPVWIGRPDGSVEYANPFWRDYTGFGEAASLGVGWADAVHPDDVPVVMERFRAASAAGEPYGVYRWHLARVAPIRNDAGTVVRWVGIALDIDDRKRGEADAARLAAIVKGSEEAIIGRTLDGIVTSWNPGAQRLFGYTAEEMLGRDVAVLIPPDRVDELAQIWARLQAGERIPSFETVRVRKDGTAVPVAITLSPIRDRSGRIVGVSTVSRDLSPQLVEREERRQRERQARLAALIGNALTAAEPLDVQLRRCAEVLVGHLDAAFARIWVLDDADPTMLALRASAGRYTHLDGPHGRVQVGSLKIGRIAADRRPHLTNDVRRDPQISDPAWAQREGMVAFAGYPLLVGDRLLGVLAVFARQPLAESTLTVLGGVADTIALGIDRAQAEAAREALLEQEQAAREHAEAAAATLALLNRVGQLVAAELDLERLVQAVTDAATELTGARFGAFFYNLADDRGETYTLYALSGAPREAFAAFPMPRSTAIFGPTFRGEGVLRLANVREDPRYGRHAPHHGLPPGHLPVTSYLAVPVTARSGEVLGGLFFGHPAPGVFDARAEELASGLAAYAAVAIDNARLYRDAHAAEQRYRGLFEGVAETILVADDRRRYRDANAAASALLGYSREELLRLRVEDIVVNEPGWTTAEYERFLADGRWHGELELRRKDGALVPVEAVATVVHLPDGPVNISAIRDVRERRAAQQRQQEFLEAVSHDLKNPLASIRVQAQLLSRRARRGPVEVERLREVLDGINNATHRMDAQLNELQDVARLRVGQPLELRAEKVDLGALAMGAVADARAATEPHQIRVEAEEGSVVGRWDPLRLRRALDNLIGNAIKYSPHGGAIVVTVGQQARTDGRWAVLTVCDEGVGIPADDLPHVFERYHRGSNVGTKTGGNGIGLAGVRQIVQQHGGAVTATSEEGRGSVFTVTLPIDGRSPVVDMGGAPAGTA
jgi:PAS domain S-box-containing protein